MSKKLYGSLLVATALFIGSMQPVLAANLVVAQQDLPVGTLITVAGIKYQIMQFEVPAFDSDKIYLVKLPVDGDPASTTTSFTAYISVYGASTSIGSGGTMPSYAGLTTQPAHMTNTINVASSGLSGFKAFYAEGYGYSASYYRYPASHSAIDNRLGLSNVVGIQLDAKTYITVNLANKHREQSAYGEGHIADTSNSLHATPTALTRTQRNKFLVDSRALFKYVVIKEKL